MGSDRSDTHDASSGDPDDAGAARPGGRSDVAEADWEPDDPFAGHEALSPRWWRLRRSTVVALRLVLETDRRRAGLLAGLAALVGLLPVALMVVSGLVVTAAERAATAGGLDTPEGRRLLTAIAVMAALYLAADVLQGVTFALTEGFRHRVDGRRTERVMAASMGPPGLSHLEDPAVHDLVQRCGTENWPDPSHFTSGVLGMLTVRVTALSSAVVVASFRWWMAVGLVALWLAAGRVMRRVQAESFRDSWPRLRAHYYRREAAFHDWAAKEVRVFGLGGWLVGAFTAGWHGVMREVWRARRRGRAQQVQVLALTLAGNLVAFLVLARAVSTGELDAGEVTVVAPALLALSGFGATDEHTIPVALGAAILPGLDELEQLVTGPRHRLAGTAPADGLPRQSLRFEGVAFEYPSRADHRIFDGLDLTIEAGHSLAIVGVNGAGKTTLVKLLARLYEPTAGRITVDGTPLTDIDPVAWQARVAAIFQDFLRYPFTAADNVGFGAVHRLGDQPLLDRAAERAGAADLVGGLPHGWDTVLTRRYVGGTDLSGGQWQRIALARALAAVEGGAGILVLDEPTAHLDVRAEVELFDRFLEVTRGTTTVLISHRFSTVRRADRIVVLHGGRVVEDGNHQELLALGGRYATAFRVQADRYGPAGSVAGREASLDG